jgi:mannose-1-phosphate guanylyltransferase
MKALLLAAGLGTRLKPFTFFQAKATLPLLDVPFIHYPLQYLRSQGIDDVVINLHAHPDSVCNAADGFHEIRIQYSLEPEILGTAGAMRKAGEWLAGDSFVVMNGDMLCNIPLAEMLAHHKASGSAVTLAIMDGRRFPNYGGLQFDDSDPPVLTAIHGGEKQYHYTGVQIVSPEIIEVIPANKKTEIFQDIYPSLLSARKITGYRYDGLWMEMGTLKQYLQTSLELLQTPLPESMRPPGMNGLVSARARIEPGASVEGSIVMQDAVIADGAVVRRSIIGPGMRVTGQANGVALARGVLPWWIQS